MYVRLIGGALVVWGLVMTALLIRRYLRGRRTRDWVSAEGEIIRSEPVRERTFVEDYGSRDPKVDRYVPRIEYRYLADRLWYSSSVVRLDREPDPETRRKAEGRCRRYPAGSPVVVTYDGKNPKEVCLEPPKRVTPKGFVVAAILVIVGAVLLAGVVGN